LKALVRSGGDDAADILRGLLWNGRLEAAGPEAPGLASVIMSKDNKECPVSASLTEADKATLLSIKQNAIKKPGG